MTSNSYDDIYKTLDGLTALAVAASMPLRKHPDEKDTAFVKRIVACYLSLVTKTEADTSERQEPQVAQNSDGSTTWTDNAGSETRKVRT
jgi:hypothetical protein